MRKVPEFLLVYLASFEVLVVVLAIAMRFWKPEWFVVAASLLGKDDLKLGHALLLLPFGLVAATYKWSDEIRNPPKEEAKKLLIEWPGYWRLKARTNAALVYAVLGTGGWIAGIYATFQGHLATGPSVAIGSVVVALVSTASVAMARLTIKDILVGG
jgi:hypothetical protein